MFGLRSQKLADKKQPFFPRTFDPLNGKCGHRFFFSENRPYIQLEIVGFANVATTSTMTNRISDRINLLATTNISFDYKSFVSPLFTTIDFKKLIIPRGRSKRRKKRKEKEKVEEKNRIDYDATINQTGTDERSIDVRCIDDHISTILFINHCGPTLMT